MKISLPPPKMSPRIDLRIEDEIQVIISYQAGIDLKISTVIGIFPHNLLPDVCIETFDDGL